MSTFSSSSPLFGSQRQPFLVDASGRLEQDIICRKCGYNLRGLSPQGVCTECGTPVGRSLMGDLLRFSDPAWVRSLASGMDWLLISSIVSFVTGCISLRIFPTPGMNMIAVVSTQVLLGSLTLYGYWRLTAPDPGGMEDSKLNRSRKYVRGAATYNFVATPAQIVLLQKSTLLVLLLSLATLMVTLILMISLFTFGRAMALRIPDENLSGNCKALMWVIVSLFGLTFCGLILIAVLGPGPIAATRGTASPVAISSPTKTQVGQLPAAPGSIGLGPIGSCVVGLLWLVILIWVIVVFFRFRSAFHDAARVALRSWAVPATASSGEP